MLDRRDLHSIPYSNNYGRSAKEHLEFRKRKDFSYFIAINLPERNDMKK